MEQLINTLTQELKNSLKPFGINVDILSSDSNITITLVKQDNTELKELIDEFKNFIDDIPDFMFEEICTAYNDRAPIELSQLSKLMEKADPVYTQTIVDCVTLFKDCTIQIATEYVNNIKKQYNID